MCWCSIASCWNCVLYLLLLNIWWLMPLFLIFIFCFVSYSGVGRYEYIRYTLFCFGFALWSFLRLTGSLFAVELSCCDWVEIKVSTGNVPFPQLGLEPMSHIPVALMAQYLNVRQRKLGTIIIQTVHILQHDNADTGSLPVEDFAKHNPSYFLII